jgi:uracil-DNA glycosylase family 4
MGYGKLLGWKNSVNKCKFLFVGLNPSHVRFLGLEFAFGGPQGDNQGVGKRFIDLLQKAEIFDDIYFTNLVKCSSLTNEINLNNVKNCICYLSEEIDILQPNIVIALGKQVFDIINVFFKECKINIVLKTTFHPSWVFRYKKLSEENYLAIIKSICDS